MIEVATRIWIIGANTSKSCPRPQNLDYMKNPALLRKVMLLLIAGIMISCTASAYLGLQSGNTARAASVFFAGLAFSILFWSKMPKKAS
jgi:hypothetical protein